jgi:uncharacterized protein
VDAKIVDFTQHLRKQRLTVSTAELMDALRAVQRLGLSDPRLVRDTLRCTLIKRDRDLEVFDDAFDRFFFGGRLILEDSERRFNSQMPLSAEALRRIVEHIRELWDMDPDTDFSTITANLLRGELASIRHELLKAMAEASRSEEDNAGALDPLQDILARLGWNEINREFNELKAAAARRSWDQNEQAELQRYLEHRLNHLRLFVRRFLDGSLEAAGKHQRQANQLFDKSFAHYTEDDIRRMHEVIKRLAQHFKNLLAIRRKRAARGHLDLKRTLRSNLQHGGVPIEVHWDHKRRAKPQVVVLCDISDSVLNASRFMMQFVYSIQELYSKVRSFVFVADIAEVTHLFKDAALDQAVEAAMKGEVINVFEHSNFGRAFRSFHDHHLDSINRRTTVIIMGDGRNNYNPANEWALREIQTQAKQLLWLNPESQSTWGLGDSEMPRYVEYCDRVEECRNVQQLRQFVERLAR